MVTTPARLMKGSVIGIAAPSSKFDEALLHQGIALLRAQGFSIRYDQKQGNGLRYMAGTDAQRVDELMYLFEDSRVDAIFCARGGFGATRLLPLVDWQRLGQRPKLFMGFSDTTALLNTMVTQCGWTVLHGPVLTQLPRLDEASRAHLFKVVLGGIPSISLSATTCLHSGCVEGTLMGGNLAVLVSMVGTPFMPRLDDSILLIEDTGEPAYRVDRMVTQLKQAGLLQNIRGIVLGDFDNIDAEQQGLIHEVWCETVAELQCPAISGVAVGHGARNLAVPLGINVCLNADDMTLSSLESWLMEE